ncbi:4Fe-4S dicluster domain-containing protein [Mesoterricola sediminis]|uniref:Heterodisulfide reductase subunit C n=1 Tax=Mesoterricola sediminis TaxID=2927980 RepID=A0AA48H2I6_9BACT|nr:4Fe-4S dicluster domain-containing protein [Mesoterricola sediminis]BDU78437.1 heterodisulfide reductase subunit C [Mesoterricola sediminis]
MGSPSHEPDTLKARLRRDLGVNLNHCYQCGKCSAGCPVAEDMDLTSSRAMRLLQMGDPELDRQVMASEGIWLCLTCETCSTRCPQEVEVAQVMDHVRHEALQAGLAHPRSRDIVAFHVAFMDSVRTTGRLYEIGLVADYKARSRHLFKDVTLAPKMYVRGKLPLLPHLIKGRNALKGIFARTLGKGR